MAEEHVIWVYAIISVLEPGLLDGLTGIGGEQVRVVTEHDVGAVIGSVDARMFGEEALQQSLAQPGELEAVARAHHHIVETVAAAQAAIPARLATVYRDETGVRDLLAERGDEFAGTLRWLSSRLELGVKVWADPSLLAGEGTAEQVDITPDGGAAAGAGTLYLRQRRAHLTAREAGHQHATRLSDEIHAMLAGLAVSACLHAAQDPRSGDDHSQMVLNGAYLVDSARAEEFSAAAVASGQEGARVEVTGPWPPYSFADGPDR
ncbi:MAG TPA: GvpL/GvpF family gas vesicle protein [Streptosporangiaceae bacterium]